MFAFAEKSKALQAAGSEYSRSVMSRANTLAAPWENDDDAPALCFDFPLGELFFLLSFMRSQVLLTVFVPVADITLTLLRLVGSCARNGWRMCHFASKTNVKCVGVSVLSDGRYVGRPHEWVCDMLGRTVVVCPAVELVKFCEFQRRCCC